MLIHEKACLIPMIISVRIATFERTAIKAFVGRGLKPVLLARNLGLTSDAASNNKYMFDPHRYLHSSDLVWTGLIIADENDACSYRWSYDCKIPDWVVFTDRPNTGRCGAIDIGLSHVMISCDEKLQFICEHDTGGKITVALSNKKQTNKFSYRK